MFSELEQLYEQETVASRVPPEDMKRERKINSESCKQRLSDLN